MFTGTNSVPPQESPATHFHRIILLSSIEELFIRFCHCDCFKHGHQYIDTSSIERWSSVLPRGSINNCCGYQNHASFTLFLLLAPLGCIHAAFIFVMTMYTQLYNRVRKCYKIMPA